MKGAIILVLEFLKDLLEVCIVPILGVIAAYIVAFINKKKDEMTKRVEDKSLEKYINILGDLVINCVKATNQTYVQALKDKDMFDANAQKEALDITFNAVKSLLSEEAKKYLSEAFNDLDEYIKFKIEAQVNTEKGTV